jgi:hypothetical protein
MDTGDKSVVKGSNAVCSDEQDPLEVFQRSEEHCKDCVNRHSNVIKVAKMTYLRQDYSSQVDLLHAAQGRYRPHPLELQHPKAHRARNIC